MSSPNKKNKSFNHLSFDDRKIIAIMLDNDSKLIDIAKSINKDKSAISREIKKHRYLYVRINAKIKCGSFDLCNIKRLCDNCPNGFCKFCSHKRCDQLCHSFQPYPQCSRITRFPHVCNGCPSLASCKLPKLFYNETKANDNYKTNVSDCKKGPKLNELQLAHLNDVLSKGLANNHSIDIIINTNNLKISTATAYRYIWKGHLAIKPLDLKKASKYKPRKKVVVTTLDYDYLKNRTYQDYLNYLEEYKPTNVWEMDCIEGKKGKGEHVILSLLHQRSNLQLYFKMENHNIENVLCILNKIKDFLGNELFKEIFELILCDRGFEFKDPIAMETCGETGELLTRVFYCDPQRSDQKGKCEKNHVHFREAIPKSISLNNYTQKQINEISNNINNYPRKIFNYNSPYQLISLMVNKKVLDLNNLSFIPIKKVIL